MHFTERLKILMDEQCRGRQSILAQKSGLPKTVISSYFCRGSQPSLSQLVALSNALGCSVDYLCGLEPDIEDTYSIANEKRPSLTKDEQKLLDTYRALNEKNKLHVSVYASIRLEEQDGATSPRRG